MFLTHLWYPLMKSLSEQYYPHRRSLTGTSQGALHVSRTRESLHAYLSTYLYMNMRCPTYIGTPSRGGACSDDFTL